MIGPWSSIQRSVIWFAVVNLADLWLHFLFLFPIVSPSISKRERSGDLWNDGTLFFFSICNFLIINVNVAFAILSLNKVCLIPHGWSEKRGFLCFSAIAHRKNLLGPPRIAASGVLNVEIVADKIKKGGFLIPSDMKEEFKVILSNLGDGITL